MSTTKPDQQASSSDAALAAQCAAIASGFADFRKYLAERLETTVAVADVERWLRCIESDAADAAERQQCGS